MPANGGEFPPQAVLCFDMQDHGPTLRLPLIEGRAPTDAELDALFELEYRARAEAGKAAFKPSADGGSEAEARTYLRQWWAAVAALMNGVALASTDGREVKRRPDVFFVIREIMLDLSRGSVPDLVAKAAAPGHPPPLAAETRAIRWAVAYVKAAKEGIVHNGETIKIDRKDYISEVSNSYSVNRRTVFDWVSQYRPAHMGFNAVNADLIISKMKKHGAWYAENGRSASAIRVRETKRKVRRTP